MLATASWPGPKAVDQLYSDRRVRLWVYVDSFAPQIDRRLGSRPETQRPQQRDAVLAVATEQRSYAAWCPRRPRAAARPRSMTSARPDRTGAAEQRLDRCGHRGGHTGSPRWAGRRHRWWGRRCRWFIIAGIGLLFIGGMMAWGSYRRRKSSPGRRGRRHEDRPTDPAALASVPIRGPR